jgi:hypothetical protein
MKNTNTTTEINKNINELVDIRLELYRLQGLDSAAAYARVTGELMSIINIHSYTDKNLQADINSSVDHAKRDLLNSKLAA